MSLEVQGDNTSFEGRGWTSYGFEYEPSEGKTGSIQWMINGTETVSPQNFSSARERVVFENGGKPYSASFSFDFDSDP